MFVIERKDGLNIVTVLGDSNGRPFETEAAAYAAMSGKWIPGFWLVKELEKLDDYTKELTR